MPTCPGACCLPRRENEDRATVSREVRLAGDHDPGDVRRPALREGAVVPHAWLERPHAGPRPRTQGARADTREAPILGQCAFAFGPGPRLREPAPHPCEGPEGSVAAGWWAVRLRERRRQALPGAGEARIRSSGPRRPPESSIGVGTADGGSHPAMLSRPQPI